MATSGIIIQARLGSSRFPNKVLAKIDGKRLIDIIVDECKKTKLPVVVAIPTGDKIDVDVPVFEGVNNDVIARYYHCAYEYGFNPIIRVCADSKMIRHEW